MLFPTQAIPSSDEPVSGAPTANTSLVPRLPRSLGMKLLLTPSWGFKVKILLSPPSPFRGSHSRWNPAAPLALSLRKHWPLPTSTQNCIRAVSNHTVFTGKEKSSVVLSYNHVASFPGHSRRQYFAEFRLHACPRSIQKISACT